MFLRLTSERSTGSGASFHEIKKRWNVIHLSFWNRVPPSSYRPLKNDAQSIKAAETKAHQKAASAPPSPANLQTNASTASTRPMIQVTCFGAFNFIFFPFLPNESETFEL
jgi:hypothetical protein